MRKRNRNIIYLIFGFILAYGFSSKPISDYLAKGYNSELNEKRLELGLIPIQINLKLDSVGFIAYGNYSTNDLENISESQLKLENEKLYCQYWSAAEPKIESAYHSKKHIFFIKSFWVWKNRLVAEYDTYLSPLSELKYAKLMSSYDYENAKWLSQIDTMDTEYKILKDKLQSDSLSKFGMWRCGTEMMDFNIDSITKNEADQILESWGIEKEYITTGDTP